jgi:hypothetical protein
MRRVLCSLVCGWLSACAATAPVPEHPASEPTGGAPPPAATANPPPAAPVVPVENDKWKRRPADAACQASLTALVGGDLAGFRGVGGCGRVDAEATIGSSGEQPSRFEQFGEYRVFPHSGGSVLVWFLGEDVRVIQLLYPKLRRPLKALVGEPEARVKSGLSPEWEQWVYASRGLSAHVKRGTGEVITLFAYAPTTVATFLESDISRVAKSEAPLEELK